MGPISLLCLWCTHFGVHGSVIAIYFLFIRLHSFPIDTLALPSPSSRDEREGFFPPQFFLGQNGPDFQMPTKRIKTRQRRGINTQPLCHLGHCSLYFLGVCCTLTKAYGHTRPRQKSHAGKEHGKGGGGGISLDLLLVLISLCVRCIGYILMLTQAK